ncbi:hypothetical protein HGP14_26745 [Rhizobium sp. P32RR-XVIII]|uniref:MEDS domain-containing protein n=1 Tax=Rhizobium sp. P32RR-XVIII TaxID=2726738 RepID=UPI0014566CDE|nr:MEDS domain-containing protein [Rhizobium sp. P32RR-XVIII]NLS06905.1 hypothetical protein [Rhizobium sp. P32RR-XVIII]
MKTRTSTIRFASSELSRSRHVCAFFNNQEDAYKVLLPFIVDGFTCGHRAVHLLNPGDEAQHLSRLRCEGIDTESAQRSGQLEVRTNADVYLREGRFDQHRMFAEFEELASGDAGSKFPLSRIVCQMDWAGEGRSDVTDLLAFEARVNDLWDQHEDAVICVYDLAKFGGETVIDIMRTHPMVVVGETMQENPFYVPPSQFLQELGRRHHRKSGQS